MTDVATLGNSGNMTSFTFGDDVLRFRTSPSLVRYIGVRAWDAGYLVVDAEYATLGVVEEYIDLIPVLRHLCRDPQEYLSPIKRVVVEHA